MYKFTFLLKLTPRHLHIGTYIYMYVYCTHCTYFTAHILSFEVFLMRVDSGFIYFYHYWTSKAPILFLMLVFFVHLMYSIYIFLLILVCRYLFSSIFIRYVTNMCIAIIFPLLTCINSPFICNLIHMTRKLV